MHVEIISQRGQMQNIPSWDAVFEFEDLMQDCLGAGIVALQNKTGLARFVAEGPLRCRRGFLKHHIARYKVVAEPLPRTDLLLVVALTPMGLENLQSIPGWREKSGKVVVYIIDSYRHGWYKHFERTLRHVDHLLTPIAEDVEALSDLTGVPTSLLPWGSDVLRNGCGCGDRRLDVMAMGRQPPEHIETIARRLGVRESGKLLFHGVVDVWHGDRKRESRELMWQMMRASHLSLCYCPSFWCARDDIPPMVTPRWLESLCAGAIPVGKRPATPLTDRLFDWEDALIDLPPEPEKAADGLLALLDDRERLRRAHARNYANMLRRHDWRYRILTLLGLLGCSEFGRLRDDLAELAQRTDGVSLDAAPETGGPEADKS
jgi:Glycosyl transferases group 1